MQFTDDILIDYINRALSPEDQATVEDAIRSSDELVGRITAIRKETRFWETAVRETVNAQPIPATMQWSAIAHQLQARQPSKPKQKKLSQWFPAMMSIIGVLAVGFALIYSLDLDLDSGSGDSFGGTATGGQATLVLTETIPATTFNTALDDDMTPTPTADSADGEGKNSTIPTRDASEIELE